VVVIVIIPIAFGAPNNGSVLPQFHCTRARLEYAVGRSHHSTRRLACLNS